MLVFLILIVVAAVCSFGLLVVMFLRDDTMRGVQGVVLLSVTGMASSAYGMLNSI